MFFDSLSILKEIIAPVKNNLSFDGYRAGGWSIQPFDCFISSFNEYNIKYDFSVWGGKYYFSDAQHFDFRNAPKQNIYNFSNNVLKLDRDGKFTEIVISAITVPKFYKRISIRLINYFFHESNKPIGDGIVLITKEISNPTLIKKDNSIMPSIEFLNFMMLPYYTNHLRKNNFLHFITHNKMLTKHNINTFEKFMKRAYKSFKVECDFRKMLPE